MYHYRNPSRSRNPDMVAYLLSLVGARLEGLSNPAYFAYFNQHFAAYQQVATAALSEGSASATVCPIEPDTDTLVEKLAGGFKKLKR